MNNRFLLAFSIVVKIAIFLWISPLFSAEDEMIHEKWLSNHEVYEELDYFTASTDHVGEEGDITLFVSREVEECHIWEMSLSVATSTQSHRTFESNYFSGRIRVDDKPIHDASYQLWFNKGDASFYVDIIHMDDESLVQTEIKQGEVLRVEIGINNQQYIIGFSLRGAKEAIERAEIMCSNYKPDRSYFGEIKRRTKDDQFQL